MKHFDISLVVPVYNVEKYIQRFLDSLIIQDYGYLSVECIFVNDFTPDRSIEIINNMLSEYQGQIEFVIENLGFHQGLSAARNAGIRISRGDYILFLDSDDRLVPEAIRTFGNAINQYRESHVIDFVLCNTFQCKTKKNIMRFNFEECRLLDNSNEEVLSLMLTQDLSHTAWNKLVLRSFLIDNNIYFEDGLIHEDILWSYSLYNHAKKIIVNPKVTYIYEDNPDSIVNTSSNNILNEINSRIIICNHLLASPPQYAKNELYIFVFFIFMKTLDLYYKNKNKTNLQKASIYDVRKNLIKCTLKDKNVLLSLFFLTAYKPLYHITTMKWYRRNFYAIENIVLSISNRVNTASRNHIKLH